MNFGKSGNFYIITRHNSFLAVELTQGQSAEVPTIRTIEPIYNFGNRLDSSRVLEEVLKGVNAANALFQTNYSVQEIHYVQDDAPPESLYGDMVKNLINELESGESVPQWKIRYKFVDS